jgi:hypothetical protein
MRPKFILFASVRGCYVYPAGETLETGDLAQTKGEKCMFPKKQSGKDPSHASQNSRIFLIP